MVSVKDDTEDLGRSTVVVDIGHKYKRSEWTKSWKVMVCRHFSQTTCSSTGY